MKFLLDTHLLLWAAGEPQRLSAKARALINDSENALTLGLYSLFDGRLLGRCWASYATAGRRARFHTGQWR